MLNPLITTLGAIIPDMDYVLGIPHRTITHSLLFLLIAGLITYKWRGKRSAWALTIGLSSHLILDLITIMGVPLLWPLNTFYSLRLTSSFNPLSNFAILLGCIICMYHKESIQEYLFSLEQGQALGGISAFLAFTFTFTLFYPVNGCPSSPKPINHVLKQASESTVRVNATICSEISHKKSTSGNIYQVFTICDPSANITVWKGDWVLENNLSKGDVIDLCGKFTNQFKEPEIYQIISVIK